MSIIPVYFFNICRMEDRGEVISIKFSPDRKILAIQRTGKSVVRHFLFMLNNLFVTYFTYHVDDSFCLAEDQHTSKNK